LERRIAATRLPKAAPELGHRILGAVGIFVKASFRTTNRVE